jgi:alpha-tubulin suppressor-like RCC1 family protein
MSDSAGLAWGLNNRGQLGEGTTTNRSSPVSPPALSNLTAIAGGGFHSLAIQAGGAPLAWGSNATGQLGDGTTTNRSSPVSPLAPANTNVNGISAGWAHSLFVK